MDWSGLGGSIGREIHDGEEKEACRVGEALELMIVEEEEIEREAMAKALQSQKTTQQNVNLVWNKSEKLIIIIILRD